MKSPRPANTVRIVFVGSSTVVDAAELFPFSHYPTSSAIGSNRWAASRGLAPSCFETLNAAREGLRSGDIAAIVRNEVLPLRPDLVLYYEGGNQFDLGSLVPDLPRARPRDTAEIPPGRLAFWVQQAGRYLALARRLQGATGLLVRPANATVEETANGLSELRVAQARLHPGLAARPR